MTTRKNLTKVFIVAAACFSTGTMLYAQQPPPVAVTTVVAGLQPPPPPPPGRPGMLPPPPPPMELQEVHTYTGTIVSFAANEEFIYDGYYLADHGDTLMVKFPPHLGATLRDELKPGKSATVTGSMNMAPTGEKEIRMLSVLAGGKTISDTGTSGPLPPSETVISGSGKITSLQLNRENVVSGLLIDNNTVLRIPPPVATQLGNSLKVGAAIAFTGMKRSKSNGEAFQGNYTLVHCQTITLNGHQYLAQ